MNELEQAILEEIQNSKEGDDILTRSVRAKDRPKKRTATRYLFIAGVAIAIGYCTYYACREIWKTEHRPLAIPAAIWGTCATTYATRRALSWK